MPWMRRVFRNKKFVNSTYIFCALIVFFIWVWTADSIYTSFNGDSRSKLADLINGSAHRPFVQRVLIPTVTRTIHQMIPVEWNESISSLISHQPKIQKEIQRLGWEKEYAPQYIIALILSGFFLILFPFALRSIVRTVYDTEEWIINVIPLVILMGLPQFFHMGTRYIYDFPALTLFSLGFYFLLQKRWLYYYGILSIGLINKETMVLLGLPMAMIYYKNIPTKLYWRHLVAHGILFIITRGFISWYYRSNPGTNLEFHFFGNIRAMADLCTPQQLIIWGVVFVLIAYHFSHKPLVLRKALFASIPFLLLTIFFGCILELRALYEVYPIFAIVILHTVFFSIFQFPYDERILFPDLPDNSG